MSDCVGDEYFAAETDKDPQQAFGNLLVVHVAIGVQLIEEILRAFNWPRLKFGEIGKVEGDFHKIAIDGNLRAIYINKIGNCLQDVEGYTEWL